jgi:thermostable 8-oxoguanine DNA glycosylase
MNTIETVKPTKSDIENADYKYQEELTRKLDEIDSDFNQDIINEIVLWKTNRFSWIDAKTMILINQIKKDDKELNLSLTKEILRNLLAKSQKGFRLAMASTILRFKNPNIYQIIDQRVYRFIFNEELNISEDNVDKMIEVYFAYLEKLKEESNNHQIDFKMADRVFYSMDKKYNKGLKIKW